MGFSDHLWEARNQIAEILVEIFASLAAGEVAGDWRVADVALLF